MPFNPNEPRDDHGRWSVIGSDARNPQISSASQAAKQNTSMLRPAEAVSLQDGTNVMGCNGQSMLMPRGTSLEHNAQIGKALLWGTMLIPPPHGDAARAMAMFALFQRHGGPMDRAYPVKTHTHYIWPPTSCPDLFRASTPVRRNSSGNNALCTCHVDGRVKPGHDVQAPYVVCVCLNRIGTQWTTSGIRAFLSTRDFGISAITISASSPRQPAIRTLRHRAGRGNSDGAISGFPA